MFLIATYYRQPNDIRKTNEPGYMKDPENYHYSESIQFARRLKPRDLQSSVILDLVNQRVVKCSFAEHQGHSYDEIYKYFAENYSDYLTVINNASDVQQQVVDQTAAAIQNITVDAPTVNSGATA